MAQMNVELVAVERKIWSGPASFVRARTTVGEIGIMPGHESTLAQLEDTGVVRVDGTDGSITTLAVHGGFLAITADSVTVLAEYAELADEIDVPRARAAAEKAEDGESAARAAARLRAAGAAE